MSSEESNISEQLKTLAPTQNSLGVQRLRRKRRARPPNVYKVQTKSPVSKRKQRKIPVRFSSVPANTLRGNNFQTPLRLPITKLTQSPVSKRKQRKVPVRFSSVPANTLRGNHFPTPLRLPIRKQGVPGVPMRGLINGQFESVSWYENQSSTFHSKSSNFHTSPEPPCYSLLASNDSTYHFYNTEGYNHNSFQNGKLVSCSPSRLASNQEKSSSTHKLVSDFIRNSQFPINTNISSGSSITSSRDRFYFQQSSSNSRNSTPNDYSTLEERGATRNTSQSISPSSFYPYPTLRKIGSHMTSSPISSKSYSTPKLPLALEKVYMSQCSALAEVGSMESILENTASSSSTTEPRSLSESSVYSSEQIFDLRRSSSESLNSSKEGWDKKGNASNINQSFMCLNSSNLHFRENFTHPKSLSEENGRNNSPQENGNISKTIISPIKRHCPSQLQTNASPLNTSTTVARKNKNLSGSISRPSLSPVLYHRPVATSSTDSKTTNLSFKDYVRKYTTLDNNDSVMMSPICPEEALQQGVGEFVTTLNPPESQKSSKERYSTAKFFTNVRQSLASLTMKHGSKTTDASVVAITSNGTNSERSANKTKTRKKSKLFSCFTSCFRLSSPQQDQT